MTDRDIADLCPELQAIYWEWLRRCHLAGLRVRAVVTWRADVDQNIAKAKGLSNAGADESPHNCCLPDGTPASKAFDFGVFDENAAYIRDGEHPDYRAAGQIGKECGLDWGGDWHHPDYDHLQMKNWKTS